MHSKRHCVLLWTRDIQNMNLTLALQVIAPLIAAASGPLGTNAQYLFSLEQELIKLGMHGRWAE